jgi:hypothetical protein
MSSLENLPNPDDLLKKKVERKRRACAATSTAENRTTRSKKHGNNALPQATEAPSISPAIQCSKNESNVDTYNDILERILLNAESRQGPKHATIFETSSSSTSYPASHEFNDKVDKMCGNLTADELNQLSVLSSVAISFREELAGFSESMNKSNSEDFSWSSVDLDSVIQLSGLLEDHVKSALSIDLIRESREFYEQEEDEVGGVCFIYVTFSLRLSWDCAVWLFVLYPPGAFLILDSVILPLISLNILVSF